MNIESPRFGTLSIEPSKIIEFPLGFAGFETSHRFTLFHPEDQTPKYFILQSVDEPELAFQITDPAHFGFSYEIELNDTESQLIKLTDPADIAVAVIVWHANEVGTPLRANLQAPLLINTRERRGLQHVFTKLNCTLSDH
ncbi:MAG: flagellar assembly protein FliW [Sterolibacterium sp.]|jgi:flagellar assembly factor FliW|nr:flagellar assembly protein FliW [Sterolibacterium sp.]